MAAEYDLAFVGHLCYDEICHVGVASQVAPGSAVLCGALAATRAGAKAAAVVRLARADAALLAPLQAAGVDVYPTWTAETTYSRVVHPSANVDERELHLLRSAGPFALDDLPPLAARVVHLAGISDQEFPLDLVRGLAGRAAALAADLQSFVRQVDGTTRRIRFRDVAEKRTIVSLLDFVKLDIVEAELLTGERDLARAARVVQAWGCPEVVISSAAGIHARAGDAAYFAPFTNRSSVGRTGRGDTLFAAYLARRLMRGPEDALRFAAALVSIKMETLGPFAGTLEDVLTRMALTAQTTQN